jgi:hypothetical protein
LGEAYTQRAVKWAGVGLVLLTFGGSLHTLFTSWEPHLWAATPGVADGDDQPLKRARVNNLPPAEGRLRGMAHGRHIGTVPQLSTLMGASLRTLISLMARGRITLLARTHRRLPSRWPQERWSEREIEAYDVFSWVGRYGTWPAGPRPTAYKAIAH